MDYRTLHTGMPNRGTRIRPILYLVYTRTWFFDEVNHAGRAALDLPLEKFLWLPDAKLAFNTDLWVTTPQPVTSSNPNLAALIAGVEKWGLQPENMSGGHGTIANYAQAARVVKAAPATAK